MPHTLGLKQLAPPAGARFIFNLQRCLDLRQLNVRQLRTRIALGMVLDQYVESLFVPVLTDKPTWTAICQYTAVIQFIYSKYLSGTVNAKTI